MKRIIILGAILVLLLVFWGTKAANKSNLKPGSYWGQEIKEKWRNYRPESLLRRDVVENIAVKTDPGEELLDYALAIDLADFSDSYLFGPIAFAYEKMGYAVKAKGIHELEYFLGSCEIGDSYEPYYLPGELVGLKLIKEEKYQEFLDKFGRNASVLLSVVDYLKDKDPVRAENYVDLAKSALLEKAEPERWKGWNNSNLQSVINNYLNLNREEKALQTIDLFPSGGADHDQGYFAFIEYLCRHARIDEAKAVWLKISGSSAQSRALITLAQESHRLSVALTTGNRQDLKTKLERTRQRGNNFNRFKEAIRKQKYSIQHGCGYN